MISTTPPGFAGRTAFCLAGAGSAGLVAGSSAIARTCTKSASRTASGARLPEGFPSRYSRRQRQIVFVFMSFRRAIAATEALPASVSSTMRRLNSRLQDRGDARPGRPARCSWSCGTSPL
jgi:hypothetical protein